MVDAINHATGGSESFPADWRVPVGARAIELAGGMKDAPQNPQASALAYALTIFGRPLRDPDVQRDCERGGSATLVQTLYLLNHPAVRAKLSNPQGRPAQIIRQHADLSRRAEEAFLWVLARLPTDQEKEQAAEFLKTSSSAQQGMEGLFRTLMLSDLFILNY